MASAFRASSTLLGSIAALALAASPSQAQVADNASAASRQVSIAAGAIGESGVKAVSGVVALPLGAAAVGSGAAGVSAAASGQGDVAGGFSGVAGDASRAATAATGFSNAPLSVTDDVVIAPQPAPQVPFTPVQQ